MSLLVNSVPGVCVWLWVYYHVYLSPVCWVPCRLVYLLLPVFLCVYLALSYLDVVIKDYYFELYPRLRVPRSSLLCAPWQKTRPNNKRRPFTSFCFVCFFKSLVVPVFCPSQQASPLAASPHACRSREFTPPFAALPSRGSREFSPPFAAQPSHRSREFMPTFAAQRSRRSREFTPPFADQPAHRSQEMTTPPSTANPSPPARHWINARRPASDSMPAGLPLIQARRIAADSSPPDCRWLKLAGLPLTHARWPPLAGIANSPLPQFTPPSTAHRPRRSREITPPSVGKANPPSAAPSSSRGRPTRRPLSLGPPPAVASSSPPAPAVEWSSQPVMVSPAGRGRIWPDSDQGLFKSCFECVWPRRAPDTPELPHGFFLGGTKVPAVEAGPRDEATATMDHLPWPPELPAPPWPPSVCSALEAPSCVCLCVGPEGSPECPPPLPGNTVTARDAPSRRGELCQTSVVCVLCSRLLFPYMVSFLSSFHVIIS